MSKKNAPHGDCTSRSFTSLHWLVLVCLLFPGFGLRAQLSPSSPESGRLSSVRDQLSPGPAPSEGTDIWSLLGGRTEDTRKRDAFSKHYKNADGSYTAVIGSGPVHYLKNQRYEDIREEVVPNPVPDGAYPYLNETNLMSTYFGANAGKGIMGRTEEGDIREFLNTRMYWETNGQQTAAVSGLPVQAGVAGNRVLYAGIYEGVDAEFTVLVGRRKLNYHIREMPAIPSGAEYLVFAEDISMNPSWHFEETARGILIKDAQGKAVYRYENPYSTDAAGGLPEDNTLMAATAVGNTLTVYIKVKASWLSDAARVYPVAVDPTVSVYPDNAGFWTGQANSSGGGTSGSPAAGLTSAGVWYRGYAKFNTVSLPACSVSDATLYIKPTNIQGTLSATNGLGISQCKYDLSSDFFPSYANVYNAVAGAANMSGDYAAITTNGTLNAYRAFSLGAVGCSDVAAKAGGAGSFFMVGFRQGWTGGTAVNRYMVWGDHTSTANRPYLSVTYTQTEPYCHPAHESANCATYADCQYIGISNVSLGTINNTTTYNNIPIGYNSYASQSTDVTVGSAYTLTATYRDAGSPANQGKVAAWIDWNKDGTFQTDEFLGVSGALGNAGTYAFDFTVPATAAAGSTRLRVRSTYTAETYTAADACKTMNFGETEDYSVNIVVPSTYTLTVSGAGTGAALANGTYTYAPGTSVTATAGTNPGYILSGWAGTGSVPATGTGNTVTFNINAPSTVTWNWVSATATDAPVFHDYGGTEQLAFNNCRLNIGGSPVFRLSHALNAATTYRLEVNTAADFTGISWAHTFTGTYPSDTETNFTFPASAGFVPVSGTTYYVRARCSGDNGAQWSAWSAGTYAVRHDASVTPPDWYQVTRPQLLTDIHQGTQATGTGIMLLNGGGGNPIVNPTFANTSGWTTWKTSGTGGLIEVSSTDCSNCPSGTTRNLKMYLWTASVLSGDMMIVSQQVDLTGVDRISYNANAYYGPNSSNPGGTISNLRFIIGGASNNEAGTVMHTTDQAYCTTYCTQSVSDQNIVVNTTGFTGVQTIKFVVKFTQSHSTAGLLSFYVNNVTASADPSGTAISTPVYLASVKDAPYYRGVEWTQTLNGGGIVMKVQRYDGAAWVDVPGYDHITSATDGFNTYDLSGMTPYSQIRLVAALTGSATLALNDWSVKFPVITPLPVVLKNFSGHCHEGQVRLAWATETETNNERFTVQRSTDLVHWTETATLPGKGNSNAYVEYTAADHRPYTEGVAYYRLLQVDYDGTAEYFAPVSVICLSGKVQNGLSVYPNPAGDEFAVAVSMDKPAADVHIKITDINGKTVVSRRVDLPAGTSEWKFDRAGLGAGTYVIHLEADGVYVPPVKLIVG